MDDRMKWQVDDVLVQNLQETMAAVEMTTPDGVLAFLEGIGTLVSAGAESDVAALIAPRRGDLSAERIEDALSLLAAIDLEDTALELGRLLIALTDAEEEECPALCHRAASLIGRRDRVALCLLGAEEILGVAPTLDVEFESAVDAFDAVLAPKSWRMAALGELRWAKVAWARPDHRHRLRWWQRGAHLPANTVDALRTAAECIAAFPEAREYLDEQIAAATLSHRLIHPPEASAPAGVVDNVVSLADWFRRAPVSMELGAARMAAAAGGDERRILHRAEFSISIAGDRLIVDLEVPPSPDAPHPVLVETSGTERLAGVEENPDSWGFPLSHPIFTDPTSRITLCLATGTIALTAADLRR